MPSFGAATEKQWAQMRATTSIGTYSLLDRLKVGPLTMEEMTEPERRAVDDLLVAEWVHRDEAGTMTITDAALKHLRDSG